MHAQFASTRNPGALYRRLPKRTPGSVECIVLAGKLGILCVSFAGRGPHIGTTGKTQAPPIGLRERSDDSEAVVVDPVAGAVVVAIRRVQVRPIVVPRTATQHAPATVPGFPG